MEGFSRNANPSFGIDALEDIATGVKNNGTGWANGQFSQNEEKIYVPNSLLVSVVQNKLFLLSLFLNYSKTEICVCVSTHSHYLWKEKNSPESWQTIDNCYLFNFSLNLRPNK